MTVKASLVRGDRDNGDKPIKPCPRCGVERIVKNRNVTGYCKDCYRDARLMGWMK